MALPDVENPILSPVSPESLLMILYVKDPILYVKDPMSPENSISCPEYSARPWTIFEDHLFFAENPILLPVYSLSEYNPS
jgi:hypothetical protein